MFENYILVSSFERLIKTIGIAKSSEYSNGVVNSFACAASGTNAGGLTPKEKEENARYIYDYLFKRGWSKNSICGLLGNIQRESVLITNNTPKLMPFADFITSDHDVGDLALVFHATYLRSGDDKEVLQERADNAKLWEKYFT